MVRVITQDTYDEVVKENMDEFDMSPEEAMKEAVAQFEAQGVDLSNIIKDLSLGSGEGHLVSTTVTKLKELCSGNKYDDDIVMKELDILTTECSKDIAHRVRAGKDGAYKILVDLLEARLKVHKHSSETDRQFLVNVLRTLTELMDTQPDLLDERGIDLILTLLNTKEQSDEILIATLQWTSMCSTKHEINRQKLCAKNIGECLKPLLEKKNVKLITEVLQVIRKMTLDDDIRFEFGKAHEHSRDLGVLLVEPLTTLLKANTSPPLVSDLMLTTATLLVRHELCKTAAAGAGGALFTVLADNFDNVAVICQANKLITALAGNDDVKRDLVNSGIVPVIVSLLTRHSSNAAASALILKCVAALTLREAAHGAQFLDSGAPDAVVQCMNIHRRDAAVQKNACWAIRNMVARCPSHNAKFLELGVEPLLNAALTRFGHEFGFDIRSALRDLQCDVALNEQWTGRGVQMAMD